MRLEWSERGEQGEHIPQSFRVAVFILSMIMLQINMYTYAQIHNSPAQDSDIEAYLNASYQDHSIYEWGSEWTVIFSTDNSRR